VNAYPQDWPEIAKRVKDEAGWRCIRCDHPHDRESGHVLTVHHADGDKGNSRWFNLLALCQRCHLHIQGKVKMRQTYLYPHSEWFRPYVAAYYAHTLLGEDLSRAEVEARMDELLGIGQSWLTEAA
jgi:hypothetical protein